MRKADIILVVLAVLAAGVTSVAVAKSDDWTGERTYRFATSESALPAQGPAPAGAAPARFEWAVPANATAARLSITVDFTGQALQGGQAVVRLRATAPDGRALAPVTVAVPIAQGATSASATLPYNVTWLAVPGTVRDTQAPPAQAWAGPLVLEVVVERPGDAAVASYAFTATASGTVMAYQSR